MFCVYWGSSAHSLRTTINYSAILVLALPVDSDSSGGATPFGLSGNHLLSSSQTPVITYYPGVMQEEWGLMSLLVTSLQPCLSQWEPSFPIPACLSPERSPKQNSTHLKSIGDDLYAPPFLCSCDVDERLHWINCKEGTRLPCFRACSLPTLGLRWVWKGRAWRTPL